MCQLITGAAFVTGGDQGIEPTAQGIVLRYRQICQPQKTSTQEHAPLHTQQHLSAVGSGQFRDGDARGGAALSVRAITGKPIKFSGIGEKLEDIEAFHPDRMASRILGMGDMLTLIEKAEKAFDAKKAAEMEERLKSNKFTLQDYYDQLVQMKSMGSMEEILAQMPGGANLKGIKIDEKQMAHTEAIILSMTPKERNNPSIIGASRKKRIAAGCGLKVEDVNRLLKGFEQMQKLIKQFSGPGAGKKMKRMRGFGGMGGFPGF